jgi:diacylglycerol kinase (ATP)
MSEFNKLLFIVNKYAGTGYQPQLEGRILDACAAHHIECTIEFTQRAGHATELAAAGCQKGFDAVIAVGGDGTVNEVARGMVHQNIPMGIIPKGSGNGFARHLGIRMKIAHALEDVITGKAVVSDTFLLNDRLSINVSGIGFDGHIANLFAHGTKRGLWGYMKLIVREFFAFREFEFSVNGESHPAFILALANSAQYGNNAWIAPNASIRDQQLQQVSVRKLSLLSAVPFALRMFSRRLANNQGYRNTTLKTGVINTPSPVAFHVDGEPCGHAREFRVVLQPASLIVLVPATRVNTV